jgi:hypothetical protein
MQRNVVGAGVPERLDHSVLHFGCICDLGGEPSCLFLHKPPYTSLRRHAACHLRRWHATRPEFFAILASGVGAAGAGLLVGTESR